MGPRLPRNGRAVSTQSHYGDTRINLLVYSKKLPDLIKNVKMKGCFERMVYVASQAPGGGEYNACLVLIVGMGEGRKVR